MAAPPPNDAESPPLPSNGIRTTVTFLIFVHFFFLLVSIKSKMTASGLEQDLRDRAPGLTPYTQYLGMDLPYTFHLTYYDPTSLEDLRAELRDLEFRKQRLQTGPVTPTTPRDIQETESRIAETKTGIQSFNATDTEFYVEAELLGAGGVVEKTILWPSNDMRPGARFHRFQRLVSTAVNYIDNGNDGPATMIAKGIADRILAENKSRTMKLRFRRRVIPNLMQPVGTAEFNAAKSADPNAPENFPLVHKNGLDRDTGVYEITAIRTDDGGIVVTETKGGYNAAAPSQSVAGQPANPNPTPSATPTASAAPTSTAPAIPGAAQL
jgi:hypothetical protein